MKWLAPAMIVTGLLTVVFGLGAAARAATERRRDAWKLVAGLGFMLLMASSALLS